MSSAPRRIKVVLDLGWTFLSGIEMTNHIFAIERMNELDRDKWM